MKDIIIVGTGKAAFLHYFSYNKFKHIGRVFFVDLKSEVKNENIKTKKVYLSIEDAVKDNNLNVNNIIVDICTPKSVFMDIIEQSKKIGIKNIMVEKPFIIDTKFLNENNELNIVMIHNYMYSVIINIIKNYIEENKLKIKAIYTNFSKNRTKESFDGRGMINGTTRNIEHDIPHQIYMAQYVLGKTEKTELLLLDEKPMINGNKRIERHGYSKVMCMKDNVLVIHESDFASNTTIREFTVICENSIVLKGEFFLYDQNLKILKRGNVKVFKENKVISNTEFEEDDNMYQCLLELYNYLNDDIYNDKYKKQMLEFSEELDLYMKQ